MATLSRRPMMFSAIGCGVMAIIGLVAATFTYMHTNGVDGISIYADSKLERVESKELYIFVFPVFQIFVFFMLALPAFRWDNFIRKSVEREMYWKEKQSSLREINIPVLYKTVCISLFVVGAILLVVNIYRYRDLLLKYGS